MPSKIDQSFIDNLQNFTKSLDNIVELMKEQAEGGDAVNKMLSALDGPKMSEISEDMKNILSVNKKIDDRTKQILEEVKASRKQKETGLFDKVSDGDNKGKIVDGIKVITLLAGGVLAIGLAFNIVGEVDFESIVALSMGILTISYAFSEIAKIKDLDSKKMTTVGLSIIVMATAITLSSFILKSFQPLDPIKMFSFVLVSAALGIGSYFMIMAVSKMDVKPKDLPKFLMLPILLPLIAAGIVGSSFILKGMQPVGLDKVGSILVTGLALVVGSFAIMLIMKTLGGKNGNIEYGKIAAAIVALPLIAAGIVISSMILNEYEKIKDPFGLLLTSLTIGISILAFVPAIMFLGKMPIKDMASGILGTLLVSTAIVSASLILDFGKYDGKIPSLKWSFLVGFSLLTFVPTIMVLGKMPIKDMASGVLGTVLVSSAIMASSWILTLGKYDSNIPSLDWSLKVGLSLLIFTPSVLLLGKLSIKDLAMGVLGTILVSTAIMASSWIISVGNYDNNYPSLKWATGVGLSLLAFSVATVGLGVIAMSGIGALAVIAGAALSLVVAGAIVGVSHVLSLGKYSTYPPLDWAVGTSLLLGAFSIAMIALGVIPFGGTLLEMASERIDIVANAIVNSSKILGTGSYSGGPTKEWAEGISLAIGAYALAISASMAGGAFNKDLDPNVMSEFIKSVSHAMVDSADILSTGNWSGGYPSKEWGEGVGNALIPFTDIFVALNERQSFISGIFGGSDDDSFSLMMKGIAHAMVDVANILSGGDFSNVIDGEWGIQIGKIFSAFTDNIPDDDDIDELEDFIEVVKDFSDAMGTLNDLGLSKLNKLTSSITIMSAIDDKKLNSIIGVLDNNKNKLSNVIDNGGSGIQNTTTSKQATSSINQAPKKNKNLLKDKDDIMIEKFDDILTKMDELLEYVIQEKGGENVGNNDSVKKNN